MVYKLFRDVNSLPEVCFSDCNNAFTIAQSVGKTPKLCEADSDFYVAYQTCLTCIDNSTNPFESTPLNRSFEELVNYCKEQAPQSSEKQGFSSAADLLSNVAQCTSCVISKVVYTDQSAIVRTATVRVPPNHTSAELLGGETSHSPSADLSQSTGSSLDPSETGGLDTSVYNGSSNVHKWIAGPIVGGVVLILLLFGTGVYLYRRGRRGRPLAEDIYQKSQLHSECIPRPEVEEQPRYELDGSSLKVPQAEMMANEIPAEEMSTNS